MIRIFEHTDSDGDSFTIDSYGTTGDGMILVVREVDAERAARVLLSEEAVSELRAALKRYDPKAGDELGLEFEKGFEAAEALCDQEDIDNLDPERVQALKLAASVAKDLRSGGIFAQPAAVSHETVLAYALFLLGQINAAEAE